MQIAWRDFVYAYAKEIGRYPAGLFIASILIVVESGKHLPFAKNHDAISVWTTFFLLPFVTGFASAVFRRVMSKWPSETRDLSPSKQSGRPRDSVLRPAMLCSKCRSNGQISAKQPRQ